MASEQLSLCMKNQAHSLKDALSQHQIEIKHTKALELVARIIYGYPSWNVAKGNSPDHEGASSYKEFVGQVGQLVDAIPELQITEADLIFDEYGEPGITQKPYFQFPAAILATAYLEKPYSHMSFYDLVAERFTPEKVFAHYPESMLPQNSYMAFQMARLMLEWADERPEVGDYPWDRWARRMEKKGQLTSDQISEGRTIYRECLQHSWDLDYVLFAGGYDNGLTLEKVLLQWPEQASKVIAFLMDTDGNTYHG